jgi:hypothetical protein
VLARVFLLVVIASVTACGGGGGTSNPEPPPTGQTVGTAVPNEGWVHVAEGSIINYQHNPPASGPHYPVWLRYEEYATAQARGYWVHNLEHGAVVFLYRPDAPAAAVSALRDTFHGLPNDPECGHPRALMTPDPAMPRPLAVVAADWILEGETLAAQTIRDFVSQHRNRAPENICADGDRP